MSNILGFSGSLERDLSNVNPTFRWGPNLSFFGLGPWAIIHGIAKLANAFITKF